MALDVQKSQISLKNRLSALPRSVGFVPTMGCLHLGHMSLIERAVSENEVAVVSIFVNPTQFNNAQDLKNYPRTLERDIEKITQVAPNALLYLPEPQDVYGHNVVSEHFDFENVDTVMEGLYRKGHFDGVGTVVKKLFDIVKPQRAYFGEKDYQQYKIVSLLVKQLGIPMAIVPCPIIREANGLAMSSRNELLSPSAREHAGAIYKAISQVSTLGLAIKDIKQRLTAFFQEQPLFELEYVEIAEEEFLMPSETIQKNKKYRLFIAVCVEGVRLIDNVPLN